MQRISADMDAVGVAGEADNALILYLAYTSRLLPRPVSVIVNGPSASGKTHMVETIATLMPPEGVIFAKTITPQALYHVPRGALRHRLIVGGERSRLENDAAAEATRALREMLGSGKLTKLVPEKNADGRIVTRQIDIGGPIAYAETTTQAKIFAEDLNRMVPLTTDERQEQTRRVLHKIAAGCLPRSGQGGAHLGEERRLLDVHHALQRLLSLEPPQVEIPFAHALAARFPARRVEARRAFKHLTGVVGAVVVLHGRHRVRSAAGAFVATTADYEVARRLLDKPLVRLLGEDVGDGARRFHRRLLARFGDDKSFKSTVAAKEEGVSGESVRVWLHELLEAGMVEQVEPGRGSNPAVWRLRPDADVPCRLELPTQDELLNDQSGDGAWNNA